MIRDTCPGSAGWRSVASAATPARRRDVHGQQFLDHVYALADRARGAIDEAIGALGACGEDQRGRLAAELERFVHVIRSVLNSPSGAAVPV